MHKIKKLRNHLIIQVGETYTYENKDYKVITAASKMIGGHVDKLDLSELVFYLKDVSNGEMIYIPESILNEELPKYNEVIQL